jgi:hypothetical protein
MSDYSIIQIHTAAPAKPALGLPCNGCGVCCAAAPCPVSALFLNHTDGACPALIWEEQSLKYRCGMILSPSYYCRWLPASFNRFTTKLMRRWIALDVGCDSEAQAIHLASD